VEPAVDILLVEDDPLAAKLVRVILNKSKGLEARTTHVTTMANAKKELAQKDFDVILLDLNLPDSSTEETLNECIELAERHPVIVLTGNDCEEIGVKAVQLGAQDYLIKGEYNDRILIRALRYARERHRMWSTLRRLSVVDELTGLYNRRGFFAVVERQYKEALESPEGSALFFFFDLDEFKEVNDTYGHDQGDAALQSFSDVLKTTFDRDDSISRVGGDEFVAFVCNPSHRNADSIVETFTRALERLNAEEKLPFEVKSSYGFRTVTSEEEISLDEALSDADAKLYDQKRSKKKRSRTEKASAG